MSFDHFEGPTLTGDPIPPVPTDLTLEVTFGDVSYHHGCYPDGAKYDVVDKFYWPYFINAEPLGTPPIEILQRVAEGTLVARFEKSWRFDRQPYRATTVQDNTLYPDGEGLDWSVYARTEIVVEHEPH